ncbi:MAG TPA: permease, partial [Roseiflexaceae bacterium]
IGGGPIVSVLVMMALAVLLSVCSTVDAFLALALSGVFGPGALLAFLVYGPMIDIKSGLMFLTTLSPRAIGLILALVTPLVFLAGLAVSLAVR